MIRPAAGIPVEKRMAGARKRFSRGLCPAGGRQNARRRGFSKRRTRGNYWSSVYAVANSGAVIGICDAHGGAGAGAGSANGGNTSPNGSGGWRYVGTRSRAGTAASSRNPAIRRRLGTRAHPSSTPLRHRDLAGSYSQSQASAPGLMQTCVSKSAMQRGPNPPPENLPQLIRE
jgi:hypothetical protein